MSVSSELFLTRFEFGDPLSPASQWHWQTEPQSEASSPPPDDSACEPLLSAALQYDRTMCLIVPALALAPGVLYQVVGSSLQLALR
jgi:hypothetical protein